jgi:hypothetical protein
MSGPTRTTGYTAPAAAHTYLVPDEEARLSGVVVPDDISALTRDIAAYRRERRRAERASRIARLLARRGMVPALVIVVAAAVAMVVAVLWTVMAPRTVGRPPSPLRLATTTAAPGSVGGLLPSTTLRAQDGSPVDIHSAVLRPEVFALVPLKCGCADLLDRLAGQAYSEGLRLGIVVPAATDDTADSLVTGVHHGRPSLFYDPKATLATAVAGEGVTVVVIDRDGTIYSIERNLTASTATSLDAMLQSMLLPDRR